jgi:anaerobic ribonucleoside-triphosphate reductase
LTNQQSGAAFNAITNTIKDSYLDIDSEDCKKFTVTAFANEESADKVTDEVWATVNETKKDKVKVDLASITGTYQDKWFEMLL